MPMKFLKHLYRVSTEFRLETCWQAVPGAWQVGELYHDGQTFYYAHLGLVTVCLSGYKAEEC